MKTHTHALRHTHTHALRHTIRHTDPHSDTGGAEIASFMRFYKKPVSQVLHGCFVATLNVVWWAVCHSFYASMCLCMVCNLPGNLTLDAEINWIITSYTHLSAVDLCVYLSAGVSCLPWLLEERAVCIRVIFRFYVQKHRITVSTSLYWRTDTFKSYFKPCPFSTSTHK